MKDMRFSSYEELVDWKYSHLVCARCGVEHSPSLFCNECQREYEALVKKQPKPRFGPISYGAKCLCCVETANQTYAPPARLCLCGAEMPRDDSYACEECVEAMTS